VCIIHTPMNLLDIAAVECSGRKFDEVKPNNYVVKCSRVKFK
jgi:hypothetical protein